MSFRKQMKIVQHSKNRANIDISPVLGRKLKSAFRGETSRDDLSKMATQSKDLITANIEKASESSDLVAFSVRKNEKKKERIGVRLTIAERKSLEVSAKQKGLSLSDYARHLLTSKQNNQAA